MGGRLAGAKTIVGGLVGGLTLFVVGFLFWATPLSALAYSSVDDATNAQLQAALAQGLTRSGTGTYMIPWPATDRGTVLFGQGPVATIHFNISGFPIADPGAIVSGLILALITGLILAIGLSFAGPRTFGERARVIVLLSLAITLYLSLSNPIFNHHGWGYWIYSFIAGAAGFSAAGLVIARWFLPNAAVAEVTTGTRH
ncbi:hypothetical protein [Sphingomonas profundi]|uniref:hypothetical protein n=1 Tax=Alterirhizorhabdus profundi TaxID=2681549 RepID=UPI0012E898EF|nr:hypothetical protein [Sphingomonas profundi]